MLSDEEKKAIEDFKECYENDISRFEYFNTHTQYIVKRDGTILNLIEKQSKEIEELNKSDLSKEQSSMKYYNLYKELVDKIKAKTEEYEKALNILLQKDEWIEPSDTIIRNKFMHYIEFGQSLLEKE